jgi:hypothetical protein
MALYLISYDISKEDSNEYDALWAKLRTMGATKILYSEWVVTGNVGAARQIYDQLAPLTKQPDRLLVQELTSDAVWDQLLISDDAFRALLRYARN